MKNAPPGIQTGEFTEIFEKALAEIQAKGQARLGDKTLVDGLAPAVGAMRSGAESGLGFKQLLANACTAAEAGKEKSKAHIAHVGKAKTLGERKGVPDRVVDAAIDAALAALDRPLTRAEIAERVSRALGVRMQAIQGGGWGSRRKVAAVPVGELTCAGMDRPCGSRRRPRHGCLGTRSGGESPPRKGGEVWIHIATHHRRYT